MPARLIALAALVLLSGCDALTPAAEDNATRAASGEVLQGSISDEMLPLQDLRSQPPTAAPLPGEVVTTDAEPAEGEPAEAAAETPEEEAPAADEPAAE